MSFLDGLFAILLVQAMVASMIVWGYWLHCWSHGASPLRWQPREPVPWGGLEVAWVALLYIAISKLVLVLLPQPLGEARPEMWVSSVSNALVLLVVPLFLVRFAGSRASDFGVRTTHWQRDFSYGAIALLAAVLPVSVIQVVVRLFLASEEQVHPIIKAIRDDPTPEMWCLVGIAAVVFAPIVEELLFRVILQGWLEKRVRPALAIVASSVAFSAMHGTSWPDPLPLLPLALVLGYVYYRRHSLLAPVVLHACFNAVNLLILALSVSTGAANFPDTPTGGIGSLSALGFCPRQVGARADKPPMAPRQNTNREEMPPSNRARTICHTRFNPGPTNPFEARGPGSYNSPSPVTDLSADRPHEIPRRAACRHSPWC